MSHASDSINQNTQIVQVLCREAITFEGLLAALQSRFPSTGWTESLLTTRLDQGIQQGRIKPVGSNPAGPVEGYTANQRALSINPSINAVYGCFCSNMFPVDLAQQGVST